MCVCVTYLGANESGALLDTAQGLAEVAAAADEGYGEVVLVDVIDVVGRRQHLTLVNVVHLQSFQNLMNGRTEQKGGSKRVSERCVRVECRGGKVVEW